MKRILVLNFFPAFTPPASGGELRYFNIYSNLSKYYDITLLSPTYSHHKLEIIEHSKTFSECRIPKESIYDRLHMEIDQENICSEVSALVCALSSEYPNLYHEYFHRFYLQADIIVHDFPYMLNYDFFFGIDTKPRVYNSHNMETLLVKQLYKGSNAEKYVEYISNLEKKLVVQADCIFATSHEEKRKFAEIFAIDERKVKLAPNGINPDDWSIRKKASVLNERATAYFIGSQHPPNIEAVDFIINNLADNCPNIEFIIAGSCCDRFQSVNKKNIKLLGKIDEKTKMELFSSVDIAINPMFSGAGTNLKTLEFLSAGIPLVSTDIGVRGLDLSNGKHYLLANKSDFASKLIDLVNDPQKLEEIASDGQIHVNDNYSWQSIAENIKQELDKLEKTPAKKTIFALNDFEVSSPLSGGEVRINKLYSNLSKRYKVVLLCLTSGPKVKLTQISDDFMEISIPKTEEHKNEDIEVNSQFWISASDIVNSYMCVNNEILRRVASNLYNISDVAIVSHPYMIMLLNELDGKPIIYESLNFECGLKETMLKGHPKYERLIEQVKFIEKTACEKSEFIVSVSDDDHKQLGELINDPNLEILTVKNGVELKHNDEIGKKYYEIKNEFHEHPIILFIGSAHQPNIEAASFIVDELAPLVQNCYFVIIGSVCDAFQRLLPDNVLLFGKLEEEYKDVILNIADVAINPMTSGSGSNLKLAEYFANKIPTITTKFGCRGYNIEDKNEAIICDLSEFKSAIESLIRDENLQVTLAENAYEYVTRELDWSVLAGKFDQILKDRIFRKNKKKLLVVTYRFTEPPLGGAEVFLLNVLEKIDRTGDFSIDVATLDIYDIVNQFHFSTSFTNNTSNCIPTNLTDTVIYRFKTDTLPEDIKYTNSKMLFAKWTSESVETSLKFIDKYNFPILMGGWYFPERVEDHYEIWSSQQGLIFVSGIKAITIKGFSTHKRQLTIYADDEITTEKIVSDYFEQTLFINCRLLRVKVEPFTADNDPRSLGVRIQEISYKVEDRVEILPLDYDFKSFLKENFYEEYIESLISNAESRPEKFDNVFQVTRGPISKELEIWLDENIKKYDVVFAHSIPFATPVIASKYSMKHHKPLLVLPHFHIDDEFYHWKSYYDAMRNADHVIAAPEAAVKLFYDKIQVKAISLPGGAISKSEYDNVDSNYFSKEYNSNLPFVLVLGRKSSAKNYKWVIEAVEEVNKKKKACNLIIIGRDEDSEKINSKDVIYLGEQSREIVLGALKECLCLINMSESESFGIVILEAWMQKKPVIVNEKCTAFVELVKNDVNGLLANKKNLNEKINYILTNNLRSIEMGEAGYKRVADEYTWDSLGGRINQLLANMVAEGK